MKFLNTAVRGSHVYANLGHGQRAHSWRVSRREALLSTARLPGLVSILLPSLPAASEADTSVSGDHSSCPTRHPPELVTNDHHSACCYGNAPPPRRVVVVGADGRTGREVVRELLTVGVGVRAAVRNPKRAGGLRQQGVEIALLDVTGSTDDIASSLKGADGIICSLGFRPTYIPSEDQRLAQEIDNLGVCRLVDAAVLTDVPRFVLVSSLLTNAPQDDPSYRALNMLGGVLDAKHASEVYLAASPLAYTIVRPGVFAADAQGEVRLAPEDTITSSTGPSARRSLSNPAAPSSCTSPLAGGSSRGGALCAASRAQVARVCVSALFQPAACRRTVEMFSVAGGAALGDSEMWQLSLR